MLTCKAALPVDAGICSAFWHGRMLESVISSCCAFRQMNNAVPCTQAGCRQQYLILAAEDPSVRLDAPQHRTSWSAAEVAELTAAALKAEAEGEAGTRGEGFWAAACLRSRLLENRGAVRFSHT